MQTPINSLRAIIKLLTGLTDKEIEDQGPLFGGIVSYNSDDESWAEKEHTKDTEGWRKVKDL